jgi:hypothetical protein
MVLAALAATLAQLIDLTTFARMVMEHGPAAEANPLVAGLLVGHGLPFVAVTKIVGLAFVIGVIAVLGSRESGSRYPRLALAIATCAVAAGLVGGLTNIGVIG